MRVISKLTSHLAANAAARGDIDLVRRAAENDSDAQRILVLRLLARSQRLAQALLHNREDARDATQAAMLEILRGARHYRGESSLERWADRIVLRTALRQARARSRNPVAEFIENGAPSIAPGGDARISASHYLERLTELQRTALLLRLGFGYSVEEIADLTGASVNTVKDRLKRARAAVRRELRREDQVDGRIERRPVLRAISDR